MDAINGNLFSSAFQRPSGDGRFFMPIYGGDAVICAYSPDCTDFSGNGLGPVNPSSCVVTETLNGEWELTLEHPLDARGKWHRLVEGNILRAPVPAAMTPQVKLQGTGKAIYKVSTSRNPLRLRSGIGTKYRVLGRYKKGTQVIVLSTANSSWYEVSCPDGKRGYMASEYLTYVRTEATSGQATKAVIESRQLRDQPFRIYRIVPELTKITVYARHVFYDLLDNMIKSYKPAASTAGSVVAQNISSKSLTEHDFTFYSDLTSTAAEVEFENINTVDAILGEGGLVEKYGAELARDWYDVFLVQRVGSDTDVQIREGKNLLGISYDVDITDVVTRIMPTGEDADGNVLYLPELYIDSPNIGSYVHPKWIHLPVSEAKEVTKGDDKKTKAQCYTEMRKAVQAEYAKGCDLPTVTLKVDFINCAETEEYRQYQFLQNISPGRRSPGHRAAHRRRGIHAAHAVHLRLPDAQVHRDDPRHGSGQHRGEHHFLPPARLRHRHRREAGAQFRGRRAAQGRRGRQPAHRPGGDPVGAHSGCCHHQRAHRGRGDYAREDRGSDHRRTERRRHHGGFPLASRNWRPAASPQTNCTPRWRPSPSRRSPLPISTAPTSPGPRSGALAAEMANIAVAQINTATISQASIDWANIVSLNTAVANIALSADHGRRIWRSAHIDWAGIADLNTAVAHIAVAQLTTAPPP